MLAFFRRFLATWPARLFFIVLIGSFALWGVADVIRNLGGEDGTNVARVGNRSVAAAELTEASRRMLSQYLRQAGTRAAPTPELRRGIAEQALQQLIVQAAFAVEAARLGLQVPDQALRDATVATPAFKGPNGQFDRATFTNLLRANGYTEARYLALMRTDLAQRQLVEAVRAGGTASDTLARLVFNFTGEQRVADIVALPFAAAAQPPAPTTEQLQRFFDSNANDYRAPEYRRIKALILTPETVARFADPTDEQLHAYYDAHRTEFDKPETRSVQVIGAPDEAVGRRLAAAWTAGADWAAMQKAAEAAGASSVSLDATALDAFPEPQLGAAVFAAAPELVSGPVKTDLGWQVFKVTAVTAGSVQSFDEVRQRLQALVAQQIGTDEVYDRANKLQDLLAGGAKVDELPPNVGAAAVTGTLDAAGNTPEGVPAPLPGSDALRAALIAHAFAATPNQPPTLETGAEGAFYAVTVESITPPRQRPFEEVAERVRDDWEKAQRRREQDVIAAGLLAAVNAGTPLADAAKTAGVSVQRTPPIARNTPTAGIPVELVRPLFADAIGHATMVETPTGFTVAVPVSVQPPDPARDAAALERARTQLAASASNDLEVAYAQGLRDRAGVTVNRRTFDQVAQ